MDAAAFITAQQKNDLHTSEGRREKEERDEEEEPLSYLE